MSIEHDDSFLGEASMSSGTSPAVNGSCPLSSRSFQHSDKSDFGEPVVFFEQAQIGVFAAKVHKRPL